MDINAVTEQSANQSSKPGRFGTASGRWAGVGPYYAMFPTKFSDQVIEKYTNFGDVVYDPFSGRGTALFSAATKQRVAIGIEISPVGWLYCKAKLRTASMKAVLRRLMEIETASEHYRAEAKLQPVFFQYAYCEGVLAFLLAARQLLNWKTQDSDWTLMALLLIELHGKRGESLSNQMRQTKAMWPEYSVRWWTENGMTEPPVIDAGDFMRKKIAWRYAKGVPSIEDGSRVTLGDNTKVLGRAFSGIRQPVKLLFTSPPYLGVTNYHIDQWMRLWLLGGPTRPLSQGAGIHSRRFCDFQDYEKLLQNVFEEGAKRLHDKGTVYIRTENRQVTRDLTVRLLRKLFPGKSITQIEHAPDYNTQTMLFGDTSPKQGEVDIILKSVNKRKTPRQLVSPIEGNSPQSLNSASARQS